MNHISNSPLLNKCVLSLFSTASIFLNCQLHNAPGARTLSASKPLLPSFAGCHHCVDHIIDLLNWPSWRGKLFWFTLFTVVFWVDCVVGSVSNGSNPLERIRVRVGTGTEPWLRLYHMQNPNHWHLDRFPLQITAFTCPDVSLQLSISVLIISWHVVYADCVSFSRSFPSQVQICDPTKIRWVAG
jgi:hypothetical protein